MEASRNGYTLVPNTDASPSADLREEGPTSSKASASDPGRPWLAEKALRCMKHESAGFATVDPFSVYGAALALPQLARSAGWTISYTALAMRGLLFMITNNLLQGFLLYMISKEERIINKFGTQMFLCDFAAHLERCPDAPNCVGPGGTTITTARLYPFDLWSTRTFVRDSLAALFPEKRDEIMENVDPGEYGVESYWLRLVCCFLFVLGLWHDLAGSWDMMDLLWCVPTSPDRWIAPGTSSKAEEEEPSPNTSMYLHEKVEVDFVQFRVAGMPLHWKLFNFFFLLCPKIYLWLLTVDIGIIFLMETSEIEDMIINCVALGFILQIDELMMSIMPPECGKMLECMRGYAKENRPSLHVLEEDEIRQHKEARSWHIWTPSLWMALVPRRLVAMVGMAAFFVAKYYVEHCVMREDGSLVSKPLRLPEEGSLPLITFFFGPLPMLFPIEAEDSPVWEMP
ncbi:unnamed protein product, partial [Effrenium voratum]